MKKYIYIGSLAVLVVLIVGGYFYFTDFKHPEQLKEAATDVAEKVENKTEAPDPVVSSEPQNPTLAPAPAPKTEVNKAKIVPPMDNFTGRITLNAFGNQPSKMKLDEKDYSDYICSGSSHYGGYHTAVDLEVTPGERNTAVPVYSIAAGVVRQASHVNGYGGLVVVEYTIDGNVYTAYYGHVDLGAVKVKAGSRVSAGQKLAELAPACSSANGNTRKHLHFGMHKGKNVVVAGYVNTKAELGNWIDPRTIIK